MRNQKYFWWAIVVVVIIIIVASLGSVNTPVQTGLNDFSPEPTQNNVTNQSTFYTQSVANVRSCASTSCEPLGTYPANTELLLPYATYNDLPEWVEISSQNTDGSMMVGYVHRSTLGISKADTSAPEPSATELEPERLPVVTNVSNTVPETNSDYELSKNPDYLFNSDFNPYKVKVYGVGVGDPVSAIDPSIIKYDTTGFSNTVFTNRNVTYRIANGKVTSIALTYNGIYNNLSTWNDVGKLGKPDLIETPNSGSTIFHYSNRGLEVLCTEMPDGSLATLVNILWNGE